MGTIGARARSWINARLVTMEPSSGRPYGAPEGPHPLRARSDRIEAVLPMRDWRPAPDEAVVDVAGRWITPGLVDCHTHLVWGGNRAREFERRLAGASYAEIAAGGGGIRATVQATRGFGGGTRPRGRRAAHAAPRRRRIEFRIRTRYCDAKAASLDEARGGNRPRPIALVDNAAEGR